MRSLFSRVRYGFQALGFLFLVSLQGIFINLPKAHATAPYEASDVLGQQNFDTYDENGGARSAFGHDGSSDVAIDTTHHRLFVADQGNGRVLVYNLNSSNILEDREPENVIGQADFSSYDNSLTQSNLSAPIYVEYDGTTNRLYVSDIGRIMVFDVTTISNGMNASYVLGQADFTSNTLATTQNIMYGSGGIAINTASQLLYVADPSANRVLVFDVTTISNGMNASYVLGQADFTSNSSDITSKGFFTPEGLAYDATSHYLYVVDSTNHRVLVFDVTSIADNEDAVNVLGQADFTTGSGDLNAKGFAFPQGISIDTTAHKLYVSDYGFNRVLIFDVTSITDNEDAVNVLGQADFTTGSDDTNSQGFMAQWSLEVEPISHRLYVGDNSNNRVLIFDVTAITDNEDAIDEIGHGESNAPPDFVNGTVNDSPGYYYPGGSAIDEVHHRLFTIEGDGSYCRVLVFNLDNANNLVDKRADKVLGQPNFNSTDCGLGPASLDYAGGLAYDPVNDRLFVADVYNNCRVLVFDTATITNGEDAVNVLGATDLNSYGGCGLTQNEFNYVYYGGLTFDEVAQRLYVDDTYNHYRVLVFDVDPDVITNGMNASYVIGQPDFITGNFTSCAQNSISYTYNGLAVDPDTHKLFISSYNCNAVYVFDTSSLSNGMNASYILGCLDFECNDYSPGTGNFGGVEGLGYDRGSKQLFAADYSNYRIMVFDVNEITNGEDAIAVLGQADFSGSSDGSGQTGFYFDYISNFAFAQSTRTLYFPDVYNYRFMIFSFIKLPSNLAAPVLNTSYSQSLVATQYQGTVTYELTSGTLPPGLIFEPNTALLSGTPTTPGTYNFSITATDDNGSIGYFKDTKSYVLGIAGSSSNSGGSTPTTTTTSTTNTEESTDEPIAQTDTETTPDTTTPPTTTKTTPTPAPKTTQPDSNSLSVVWWGVGGVSLFLILLFIGMWVVKSESV